MLQIGRWYYNCALDILQRDDNIKNCTFGDSISYTKVRDIIRMYEYKEERYDDFIIMDFIKNSEKKSFPKPDYWSNVHNRIPRGSIKTVVGNLNSAFSNKRNGNIKKFNLSYKGKKDSFYTHTFEDKGYPKDINKIKGIYKVGRRIVYLKDIIKSISVKNLTISFDREKGVFNLFLPVDTSFYPDNIKNQDIVSDNEKYSFISLDTGVRTFQTGYSTNHIISIGDGDFKTISERLKKTDKIQDDIDGCMNKKKRKKLMERKKRQNYRIKCLVTDLHWKSIKFLVSNYKVILLPDFRIGSMVRKSLNKMTKRLLYMYSYYRFKERLLYKASLEGVEVRVVDESYTSKTCTNCGKLNEKLGSSKEFKCPNCKTEIDRDVNGARNILIKNWPTLQGH